MTDSDIVPRVVVVEDEQIVAYHLQLNLEKLGCEVVGLASSGDEALKFISLTRPDLVFMDIRLDGDLDGIDTASQIPSSVRSSVVYLTAHAEMSTIQRASETEPYGYLLKPVSTQDLHITVKMVMARRRADYTLRENEERLRLAFQAAGLGSWELIGPDGELRCSDFARSIFGFEQEGRILWTDLQNRIADSALASVQEAIFPEWPGDAPRRATFPLVGAHGAERWLNINVASFPTPTGATRVIGVVRDVTDRRRKDEALDRRTSDLKAEMQRRELVERHLRRSEEAFRELFQNNPLPMWVLDRSSLQFLAVNDRAISTYGFSQQEFLSMTSEKLVQNTPEAIAAHASRWSDPDALVHPNVTHFRRNGEAFQVDLFRRKFQFEATPAYLVVAIDVTQRNAVEEHLRHSQKMEAVGQLTGGVAHDFNNLLAVIYGNLEIAIGDETVSGPVREMLTDALDAAAHGAGLTKDLLSFSRRQHLAPTVIDITKAIADLDRVLRRLLEESITIEVRLGKNLWLTTLDPAQLQTALFNLTVNARDAMPSGGNLLIDAENMDVDDLRLNCDGEVIEGRFVRLGITDTGAGMDKATLDRVLEPFFTTKPTGKGTGLGLSMVYGFVKQSGGHLRILSEPAEGTTVELYLPRATIETEITTGSKLEVEPLKAGPGEVVLIIDDAPSVSRLAARVLADLGYRTIEASDGPSGMEILDRGDRVDLILTDVVLPNKMDGPAVARAAQLRRPGLPIVFMTGYAPEGVLANGALENELVLSKPFAREELARIVREALDRRASSGRSRVLVMDDEPAFGRFVARVATAADFEVEVVTNARDFISAYTHQPPDVIVLDMIMPEMDGIELVQWLAEQGTRSRIILISGGEPLYTRMAGEIAFQKGGLAVTTLMKPIGPDALRAALM